ncbi:cell division protein SepF [Solicola gregarius]|uniref:Cell division protein SepF n=1 Tax=Solicola gregarius TaxID=2908642 RepID=A0AA46THB1_9ACTN|nr:cell division protein SepF [Solicola gregarius]UYM05349.1 cell division protein SepF [Solicola gregarius]
MAGAMRKMGVYLGLVEGSDQYDETDDEFEADDSQRSQAVRNAASAEQPAAVTRLSERRRPTPLTPAPPITDLSRITTLHPRTFNEARTLGEEFREGTPVIMNLSEMDGNDAKRLVDFAAGLVFAVHGAMERVTNKVFLLSPPNVSVAAEEKQRIAEGGFFNQS